MPKNKIVEYLIAGVKVWVSGVVTTLIMLIPMVVLGFAAFSMATVTDGGPVVKGLTGGAWLAALLVSLIVQGWVVNKLWKWK